MQFGRGPPVKALQAGRIEAVKLIVARVTAECLVLVMATSAPDEAPSFA